MHEVCPELSESNSKFTPNEQEGEAIWYVNDAFRSKNAVVGWAEIGTTSRPVTRKVVGRVAESVVLFPNGSEGFSAISGTQYF